MPDGDMAGVARTSAVLRSLAERPGGGSLKDISDETGLPASSVHRQLTALVNVGFVEQVGRGRYRLGIGIWAIGMRALSQTGIPAMAQTALAELSAQTAETTHMTILDGRDVVYVARSDSPQTVAVYRSLGDRVPAFATGSGKCILAHSSSSVVDHALDGELVALTPYTNTDLDSLKRELDSIRRRGYVVNMQEAHSDAASVAAPIISHDGFAIAGLSVSLPAFRATEDKMPELIDAALATAAAISHACGGPGARKESA